MDDIRRIAYETVLRACGFGSLTIFCIMIGLSFDPRISFQSGGVLTMVMTLILVLKAYEARTKPYRRTEMWLYLPKEARPPASLRATNHRDRHARGLSDLCALDLGDRHRHVGDSPHAFVHRPVILASEGNR